MDKPTKQLANVYRKLGLLHYPNEKLTKLTEQVFQYLLVIDFESTCWEDRGKQSLGQEIIEFPAVLLNLSTGEILEKFQQYVMPIEQPKLSSFCTRFTGITQDQVDLGVPLPACLFQFRKWLSDIATKYNFVMHKKCDGDQLQSLCTLATWTDWDLTTCLANECRRKQIYKAPVFGAWIDLKATYKNFYEKNCDGLRGALQDIGLSFQGREHCGLDDSVNTARLAFKMIQDGCVLRITKQLK